MCSLSAAKKAWRYRGPDYSKIIAIDAGNCTDVYQCIDFARQYGLEVKKVLQSIVVSRIFTIYQLAHLIIFELPKIIEQFSSRNKIIVIYGLLHLFVYDSHIDKADAKQLIKEIAGSLWKLSKDRFVLASFTYSNSEYEKQFVPVFDKCIKVTNDINDNRILQMNVSNHNTKKKDSLRKAALRLKKRELLLVS
jgi:hypothetical protein